MPLNRPNLRSLLVGSALLILGMSGWAQGISAAKLERLLRAEAKTEVPYDEVRESPWLSAPVTTHGVLKATGKMLEKQVLSPRAETWRLLEDRAEWIGADGTSRKEILFRQAPALQVLADVSRRAMMGDLTALSRDFDTTIRGDDRIWSVQLVPRTPIVSRHIESVELQGTGDGLKVLIVSERQGERTTTRLLR